MTTHIRRTLALLVIAVLAGTVMTAGPAEAKRRQPVAETSHRVAMYYQTQYVGGSQAQGGTYVSPLPLGDAGATTIMVGAFHLDDTGVDHLNDLPPDDPQFDRMWGELAQMQDGGVEKIAMVGGAAPGTFDRLDTEFETYYPRLRSYLSTYGFDGVDLDVEQPMSLAGMVRLIDALRSDFGADFKITLTPVATALAGGGNLSGFSYDDLYAQRGNQIDWFNVQFYCGWGSLASTRDVDAIVRHGVVPASKIVAGTLTNPANCGSGYVDPATLDATIADLRSAYPGFGGIFGWEYFNSLPDTTQPWLWTDRVAQAVNG